MLDCSTKNSNISLYNITTKYLKLSDVAIRNLLLTFYSYPNNINSLYNRNLRSVRL